MWQGIIAYVSPWQACCNKMHVSRSLGYKSFIVKENSVGLLIVLLMEGLQLLRHGHQRLGGGYWTITSSPFITDACRAIAWPLVPYWIARFRVYYLPPLLRLRHPFVSSKESRNASMLVMAPLIGSMLEIHILILLRRVLIRTLLKEAMDKAFIKVYSCFDWSPRHERNANITCYLDSTLIGCNLKLPTCLI